MFSHGWPLNGDARDDQSFLAPTAFRRSRMTAPVVGVRASRGMATTRTPTPDLAQQFEALDLRDAIIPPEVARWRGTSGGMAPRQGGVLEAAPPLMLKTDANPDRLPIAAFDEIRAEVSSDRSQFFKELSEPFYGANRETEVSRAVRNPFLLMGMMVGEKGGFDCIKAFSETNFTENLAKLQRSGRDRRTATMTRSCLSSPPRNQPSSSPTAT